MRLSFIAPTPERCEFSRLRRRFAVCMLFVAPVFLWAQADEPPESVEAYKPLPILTVFHEGGWNILKTPLHNYGFDFLASGLVSYGMIEGGFDWTYYTAIYGKRGLKIWGGVTEYMGTIMPIATPVLAYGIGRLFTHDLKLQVFGAALAQTLMINSLYQSFIKVWAGRQQMCNSQPTDKGSDEYDPYHGDYSKKFRWGFLRGRGDSDPFGFVDGWPSGHTANAVATAVIVSEFYGDENIWISIGAWTYAAFIGVGMSYYDHWASDIIGGALIGFAVGKTVAKSFKKLIEPDSKENSISFYFTGSSAGVRIRI